MKKLLTVLALTTICGTASAGSVVNASVQINTEKRFASGSLSAARFSQNKFDQIGCSTTTDSNKNGEYTHGFCEATVGDNEENRVHTVCYINSDQPEMIARIESISPSSYIGFQWIVEDALTIIDGVLQEIPMNFCKSLRVSNQSMHIESTNTDNNETQINQWQQEKVYVAGDIISYKEQLYVAKYWTQGNTPKSQPDGPWALMSKS